MTTRTLKRPPYADLFIYMRYERNAPNWRRQVKRDSRRFVRRDAAGVIQEGLTDDRTVALEVSTLTQVQSYTGDRFYSVA